MKLLKSTVISLVTITLFACASNPAGDSDKAITEAVEAPDAWVAAAESVGSVTIEWFDEFQDPLLLKLIEEGKSNNLDLKTAAGNVELAWVLANQAGASLQPVASISLGETGSSTATGDTPSSRQTNLTGQVSWELDIWGRIRAGSRAAVDSARSAEADYRFALHSLGASIAKAYFIVIEAKMQAEVTRKNLNILTDTMRIVKVKFENGLASSQDVSLARAQLASAEENLLKVESSKREAIRALELLLGRYPNAELELPDSLPVLPPSPPAGLPSTILERRPDIIAAERTIAAAFNSTEAAKAAALPSFSLTSTIGGASGGLSDVLNAGNVIWQLAANLMVPIFDQGSIAAQIEVANIEQKQAISSYVKAALNAFSDVETNLDLGQVLVKRERHLITAQKEINNAYRLANLLYQEGESELLDVLTIQQNAIAADSNSVAIRRLLLEQRINLYLALGGEW